MNSYPYWKQSDGENAIWFNKVVSTWLVGPETYLGEDNGGISGPFGDDTWPHLIFTGWQYNNEEFELAAPREIIIEDKSDNAKYKVSRIKGKCLLLRTE